MKNIFVTAKEDGVGGHSGSSSKGNILRVKLGYNPNSSSIGSMIFAIPVAMLGVAVGFGAISGMIFSAFSKKNDAEAKDGKTSVKSAEVENSTHIE